MALGDRIRRLEDAAGLSRRVESSSAGASEAAELHRRIFARLYHSLENGRRGLSGRDPLPLPEELRETREEILDTLGTTIPHYRRSPGYQSGGGAEFLAAWEDRLLEQLAETERGENDG